VESISFSALKDFWPNKDELLRFLGNRYRRDFAVWSEDAHSYLGDIQEVAAAKVQE